MAWVPHRQAHTRMYMYAYIYVYTNNIGMGRKGRDKKISYANDTIVWRFVFYTW